MNAKQIGLLAVSGLVLAGVIGLFVHVTFPGLPEYDISYPHGEPKGIFIYMHGAGGGKEQGRSDTAFKGSFARLQTALNDELSLIYVTPETVSFNEPGGRQLAKLIDKLRAERPTLPIYLAGASAGGRTAVYATEHTASLDGLILISPALTPSQIEHPPANLKRLSMFIEHGTEDPIVNWRGSSEFEINVASPSSSTIFAKGDHNTPLETIDWSHAIRALQSHDFEIPY